MAVQFLSQISATSSRLLQVLGWSHCLLRPLGLLPFLRFSFLLQPHRRYAVRTFHTRLPRMQSTPYAHDRVQLTHQRRHSSQELVAGLRTACPNDTATHRHILLRRDVEAQPVSCNKACALPSAGTQELPHVMTGALVPGLTMELDMTVTAAMALVPNRCGHREPSIRRRAATSMQGVQFWLWRLLRRSSVFKPAAGEY